MATSSPLVQNQPVHTNGVVHGVATVKLTHADLTAASTSEAVTLATLMANHPNGASVIPANAIPQRVWLRRVRDFSGTDVATCVFILGDAGDTDELTPGSGIDIFTGAKATAEYTLLAEARPTTTIPLGRLNVIGATADVLVYRHKGPPFVITEISTVINKALTTGNATVTGSINATPITNGALTLTQSGSAAFDVDTAAPTAANRLVQGDLLKLTAGGTNDAAGSAADCVIEGYYQLGVLESAYAPRITVTTSGANVVALSAGELEILIEYVALSSDVNVAA